MDHYESHNAEGIVRASYDLRPPLYFDEHRQFIPFVIKGAHKGGTRARALPFGLGGGPFEAAEGRLKWATYP